jgi:hypothetical protein
LIEAIDWQTPVPCAGRGNDRSAGNVGAIAQSNHQVAVVFAQRRGGARTRQVCAELLRLHQRALRQVVA